MKTSAAPTDSDDSADSLPSPTPNPAVEKHQALIAENDDLIRSTDLDNGAEIAAARTAIFTSVIAKWAEEQQAAYGFDLPFAVAALGGTGRAEVTPCSDLDIAFLFEGPIEEEPILSFLLELQRQTLNTREFRDRFGFSFVALPYGLDDVPGLKEKDLNAFLDLAPVYDPHGLTNTFRQRISETFDPFEHFLHVSNLWRRQWERTGARPERVDRFDLKNNALRLFLAAVWILAGKGFEHSHDIYKLICNEDPRDLAAYHFLLRLRGWIHLRREPGGLPTALGNHAEDVMTFHDFDSLGDWVGKNASDEERHEFSEDLRARILDARRRIGAFSRGVVESELRLGRPISEGHQVALGAGGLYQSEPETCVTGEDRSRAALSLLLMSQRYEMPIDPSELQTTFLHAGDWLVPVPELGKIFREARGSLANTFDFLSKVPGAEERLFPGYGKFESSIDERVRTEQQTLRGHLEREKIRSLEADRREGQRLLTDSIKPHALTDVAYDIRVEVEAARLNVDQLAAVKLAIKTKRLPVVPDDLATRDDSRRSLADRFSSGFSGIPVADYYTRCFADGGFDPEILDLAQFLVTNRKAFRESVESGLIDDSSVKKLLRLCDGDLDRLRALYVFIHADRHAWKSPTTNPAQFFNIRELYAKARMPDERRFNPKALLGEGGYADSESQEILIDFGRHFYEGIYRHYVVRLGGHLLRLQNPNASNSRPKAIIIAEDQSRILAVAAKDDRGIAAAITGTLWKHGVSLEQAHLFSATNYGLALDFFHLAPKLDMGENEESTTPFGRELEGLVETAIIERQHVSDADEAALPDVARSVTLTEWRPELYCLRAETDHDVSALLYLLCLKAGLRLSADIHGLAAQSDRNGAWASVYLSLPKSFTIDEARQIAETWG